MGTMLTKIRDAIHRDKFQESVSSALAGCLCHPCLQAVCANPLCYVARRAVEDHGIPITHGSLQQLLALPPSCYQLLSPSADPEPAAIRPSADPL